MDITNLSYAQSPMVKPHLYCTIPDRLRKFSTETPDKAAFIIHSVSRERDAITCSDVYIDSLAFAKGLVQLGIRKGDTVGIALPNSRQWLVSTFGIQMTGAVPLFMGYKHKDGSDIIPILKDAENCKAIIINRRDKLIDNIITSWKTENGKTEVSSQCLPSLRFIIANGERNQDCMAYSDVLSKGTMCNDNTDMPELDPDDIAAFFLTSGSTGLSKLVAKTHLQILAIGQRAVTGIGMTSSDVFFNDRLFTWVGGFPAIYLVSGGTRVTCRDQFTLKSSEEICNLATKTIKIEKCSVAVLLPVLIFELRKKHEPNFHVRTVFTGALPIPKECSEIVGRFADELIAVYGSTEMHFISVKKVRTPRMYSSYCIGRPCDGVEMKIVDPEGNILKGNQSGELYVRNRMAFNGYHNNAAKTNKILDTNGWYKTDDSAYMDENGDFFVIGRCSDIIICYGELIAPAEVENEIRKHPSVSEVCVVPISDPIGFQRVCACIVLRNNTSLTEDELRLYISAGKQTVPYRAKSRLYLFFESLPKTAVGKVFLKGVKEVAEKRLSEKQLAFL